MWTFKLKKGIQFHKGFGELTAEDVKFSFERQIKRTPGTLFGVNLEVIKSIEVVDPHTVQIALKAFDPIFLLRMVGYQQGYIVSKKAVEKFGEQYKWNPVGTGPFYFERHSPREKMVLKAFDKFHGGRPQIDEVHWFDVPEDATKLIGLEKGTFDLLYPEAVTADFADQVKKMGAVIDRRGPGGQERFYINMTKPPFDDIRVRQGVHARHRPQGHQGDHVSRRPRAPGRAAACRPATSATSRCSSPSTTRRWPRSSWPRPAIPTASRSSPTSSASRSSIPRCSPWPRSSSSRSASTWSSRSSSTRPTTRTSGRT